MWVSPTGTICTAFPKYSGIIFIYYFYKIISITFLLMQVNTFFFCFLGKFSATEWSISSVFLDNTQIK